MNFKDVYEELINGKKIRRKSWKEGNYININNLKTLGKESLTAEDWEIVEEKERKKQWWEPKVNEQYFYIRGAGCVDYNNYDNDKADKLFQSFGNYFQTKEQAEFMAEKLRVIYELEKFAFENNEEEIDWNNEEQTKYTFVFNHKLHEFAIDCWSIYHDNPFNVYFTSKDIVYKAIETIGEERLKKYFFGVK